MLGQLVSNGDCLYATAVARQIKTDYPDCHLTWAIAAACRAILDGNPHVDEIWELPIQSGKEGIQSAVWEDFERQVQQKKQEGRFDEVFLTQVTPGNLQNHAGSVRAAIFRAYSRPITVPVAPVLQLSSVEVEKVAAFAREHRLSNYQALFLFECSPQSEQSFVSPTFALEAALKIIERIPNSAVILSSAQKFESPDPRIIDGSVLTLRETAELTKYCTFFIGCSSGISWVCTSEWAKPLPKIQLLRADLFHCNSMQYDFELQGLDTQTVLEMTDCDPNKLVSCLETIHNSGFAAAKTEFHQRVPLRFENYIAIQYLLISQGKYRKALQALITNLRAHGLRRELIQYHLLGVLRFKAPWLFNGAMAVKNRIRGQKRAP